MNSKYKFIGKEAYKDTPEAFIIHLSPNGHCRFEKLEDIIPLLCFAIKNGETISFTPTEYYKDNPERYFPLTREQRKALEIMYERKVNMKSYNNPFVKPLNTE